jgi:hypothetical protein
MILKVLGGDMEANYAQAYSSYFERDDVNATRYAAAATPTFLDVRHHVHADNADSANADSDTVGSNPDGPDTLDADSDAASCAGCASASDSFKSFTPGDHNIDWSSFPIQREVYPGKIRGLPRKIRRLLRFLPEKISRIFCFNTARGVPRY